MTSELPFTFLGKLLILNRQINAAVLKCSSRNWTISAEKPKFHSSAYFRVKTTDYTAHLKIQRWSVHINYTCGKTML